MLFEKIFSGGNSSKDMHSNQYAVGTSSKRTFSERKRVEQDRSRIAAYRHSKLGQTFAVRDRYKPMEPQVTTGVKPQITKRETGVQPASPPLQQRNFQEPPRRNFNPYD